MKLYKQVLLLTLCFTINKSLACVCGEIPSIEEYEYIALVEITGVLQSELYDLKSYEPPTPRFHEVKIRTIEHFKGREQKYIIIHGGNTKYNLGWTSCDLGMEIGEQWLIFGNRFKGKISTQYCSLSGVHVNNFNETEFKYNRSINRLDELRELFKMSSANKQKTGSFKMHYPNGKLKLEENFQKGSKEGERISYFSNGQVMLIEYYKNGLKDGTLEWFYKDGGKHRICEYKNGHEICEDYYYDRNGNINRINFYDDNGKYINSVKK